MSPHNSAVLESIANLAFVQRLPDYMHHPVAKLLFEVAQPRRCDPGEVIIREREIGGALGYILIRGRVRVEREGHAPVLIDAPALLGEMHQFNPNAERSATVSAEVPAEVVAFAWHELYERVRAIFPVEDQQMLLESLERLVEERLDEMGLVQLPLFQALPPAARVKICLLIVWLGRPKHLESGELLAEQGTPSGNTGFLLQRGSLGSAGVTTYQAPAVLGVQPDFDPERRWLSTLKALSTAEVLVFNWIDLLTRLERRHTPEEQEAVLKVLRSFKET